jgi:hypothetical protein
MSDIRPVGNFDSILETLNQKVLILESRNSYSKGVSEMIKLIVNTLGMIDVLESFETPYTGWNYEEQKICLLYTHILIIRCNNIAQKYLNNIEMEPIHIQLMDYINNKPNLKKVFGKLEISE